ncbi:MAG TPA: ShlB/FhaC/HecB family hemolysin secretion/activation protein, partial [Limnochordales bacterium]
MRSTRFGFEVGLGGSGLRAQVRTNSSDYAVVQGAAAGLATGGSHGWAASLRYPMTRSRTASVYGRLQYETSVATDRLAGLLTNRTRTDVWLLGLSGEAVSDGGRVETKWDGAMLIGAHQRLGGIVQDAFGPFMKVSFELNRTQAVGEAQALVMQLRGQWTGQNLPTSQKFSLGGPNGARAYPVGEASGDLGSVGSLELRWTPPGVPDGGLQLSEFVDAGWIQLYFDPPAQIPNVSGRNRYVLAGAGVGAVWRMHPNV